ncbi:MAG TPA: glycine--tRNA ligase [Nitrososphaerales archaeon]|nr:glycine--tRNA ligase [Nitrososphaerales archaeon]
MEVTQERKANYDELLRLALERGFFFPSAEIYNDAPAGFWEYGPVGLLMKNNFVRQWRQRIVKQDDMVEIEGSVILPKIVFEASGHLSSLVDPLVQCTKCGHRVRADKYISEKTGQQIDERLSPDEFQELIVKNHLRCPKCGGEFGRPTKFNMMFRVGVGAEDVDAYLRPETAQSIFVDFSRLSKTMRIKLPKGIAQVGKSFRNEIAPRQSLIRLRELMQAEAEVFFNPASKFDAAKFDTIKDTRMNVLSQPYSPSEDLAAKTKQYSASEAVAAFGGLEIISYYFALLQEFYEAVGFKKENTRFRELSPSDRAFYTTSAFDFEVNTSLGWLELVACNYRTDYDLSGHARMSKKDLSVMDEDRKVLPHVIELSLGVDRSVFALLDSYYYHEQNRDTLRLSPRVAPYLAAVFPLISKPEFENKARAIFERLKKEDFASFYDDSGAIGRRYRRMDEIGTPYCITVDHQTLEDDTVTLRERDSMMQKRLKISELPGILNSLRDA